jgi:hypothetical protein
VKRGRKAFEREEEGEGLRRKRKREKSLRKDTEGGGVSRKS